MFPTSLLLPSLPSVRNKLCARPRDESPGEPSEVLYGTSVAAVDGPYCEHMERMWLRHDENIREIIPTAYWSGVISFCGSHIGAVGGTYHDGTNFIKNRTYRTNMILVWPCSTIGSAGKRRPEYLPKTALPAPFSWQPSCLKHRVIVPFRGVNDFPINAV